MNSDAIEHLPVENVGGEENELGSQIAQGETVANDGHQASSQPNWRNILQRLTNSHGRNGQVPQREAAAQAVNNRALLTSHLCNFARKDRLGYTKHVVILQKCFPINLIGVRYIKSRTFKPELFNGELECSICMHEYKLEDFTRTLPCTHGFHKVCIDNWLRMKAECPICRSGPIEWWEMNPQH